MEKKLLVNTIKDVYILSTRALKRSEMLNFGLFAFSLIFCSINIYLVRGSSMAINSKFIAVWILLTMFFGAFIFGFLLLWTNKVSLWKDKRLLEDDKRTSEKKDRSLIFYKDVASYKTSAEYLKYFYADTTAGHADPTVDKLMRDFAKEILITSRVTKRKMFVYKSHVILFSIGFIAYLLNYLLII